MDKQKWRYLGAKGIVKAVCSSVRCWKLEGGVADSVYYVVLHTDQAQHSHFIVQFPAASDNLSA